MISQVRLYPQRKRITRTQGLACLAESGSQSGHATCAAECVAVAHGHGVTRPNLCRGIGRTSAENITAHTAELFVVDIAFVEVCQSDAKCLRFRRGISEGHASALERGFQKCLGMFGIGEARVDLSQCCLDRCTVKPAI